MDHQMAHGTAPVAVHTAPYPVGTATVRSPNAVFIGFSDLVSAQGYHERELYSDCIMAESLVTQCYL